MTKTSSKSLYVRSGTSFLLSNLLNTMHVYEIWLGWCCIFQISWLNLIVFIQWWSECYCHAVETSCTVFIQIVQYSFSLTCTLYIYSVSWPLVCLVVSIEKVFPHHLTSQREERREKVRCMSNSANLCSSSDIQRLQRAHRISRTISRQWQSERQDSCT